MFGRNAKHIGKLTRLLLYTESDLTVLQDHFERLEKLVYVGTTRLDLHAQRLGSLEDDLENLK